MESMIHSGKNVNRGRDGKEQIVPEHKKLPEIHKNLHGIKEHKYTAVDNKAFVQFFTF
jgi:hypothetical protein